MSHTAVRPSVALPVQGAAPAAGARVARVVSGLSAVGSLARRRPALIVLALVYLGAVTASARSVGTVLLGVTVLAFVAVQVVAATRVTRRHRNG
jgi:hypothetical protein